MCISIVNITMVTFINITTRCSFHGRLVFLRDYVSKADTHYVSAVFLDGSGEIKAIGWGVKMVTQWMSQLKLNEVYTISNFKINTCDSRFSRIMPGNVQFLLDQYVKVNSLCYFSVN